MFKRSKSKVLRERGAADDWRDHTIYDLKASCNRIVTRSQTPFVRIKNTPSDLALFLDAGAHSPPDMPHLMVTLKGPNGAIPSTIITRSMGQHLEIDKKLCSEVDRYKKFITKRTSRALL
ncbi:uncharacterized protein TNIN_324391 [Trichonephila inaurata madagascariensis]|uniref:Uncharacterized protein n=1 Tax=Trichonephila inaurata madagascariensis TaxID=2747483 RepID=A0A8X6XR81_9ARAC|nr:uncharacterized protein TNIN_324391 [Trichonephila inaurata madagascariensis]